MQIYNVFGILYANFTQRLCLNGVVCFSFEVLILKYKMYCLFLNLEYLKKSDLFIFQENSFFHNDI